ncbi:MAG: hypothetical protein F9K13_06170 [Candidatus Methylomirabilis oxygeniifera]|uniref:Zinc finger CGNR domain-containing protein n=1 Tax=Methylomirabilis oxygeniifera TaxID=671143 RepID=D5MHZ3_METO1|nr:MAG: hypothetical protein F9K13_06170 [Candidatus Methylomirabilis oxyfera]CBE69284.1 protein of unknown function [Candidatus Methylomirabilis oxyfera]
MVTRAKRVSGISTKDAIMLEKYQRVLQTTLQWSVMAPREDRLRWILEFAAEDIDALTPDERFERAVRLRCFMWPDSSLWCSNPSSPPRTLLMPDAVLHQVHAEINQGLRVVLGEQRNEEWYVPGPVRIAFYRASPRFKKGPKAETAPGRTRFAFRWDWGDDAGAILAGIIHLIHDAGSRLRGCKECGKAFIAVKRQLYCGEDCSQRKRDRDKRYRSQARE